MNTDPSTDSEGTRVSEDRYTWKPEPNSHFQIPHRENNYSKTNLNWDVKWYRHHRVHDNGVGEEHEEGDDHRALHGLRGHQGVPGQVHLETLAKQPLPDAARHHAEKAYWQQEKHYLWTKKRILGIIFIIRTLYIFSDKLS